MELSKGAVVCRACAEGETSWPESSENLHMIPSSLRSDTKRPRDCDKMTFMVLSMDTKV